MTTTLRCRRCPRSPGSIRCAARPRPSARRVTALADDLVGGGASNNWVVSGARTRSGKPLLANDPHLRLAAPSVWYLAHLALGRPGGGHVANAVGATLAGVPLVVLGRGDTLAWGFTNTGADVQDVFIEKVNPDNPDEYLTPEGWRPFAVDEMTITVKGVGDPHGGAPPHPAWAGAARHLSQRARSARARLCGGAAVDRAAGRRHHDCRGHVHHQRAGRRGLHGAHAPVRRADAEHGGGRYDRQDRHDRAGARARARCRQQGSGTRARARLGFNLRLEGVPGLRGPAARRRSASRRHRHGQCQDRRARLSALSHLRLGFRVSPEAHQGACDRQGRPRHREHACGPGRHASPRPLRGCRR